ncbi:MAG: DUF2807 domain-containing protein [Bacteroidales bacterium]|jgi:hypothetical protein|nr:DUF2807 domain-containing protein [Bacteroidales bacterium]MDD4215053.1 DUF2807 domain-containing protein [Bacteroidales bacterium]
MKIQQAILIIFLFFTSCKKENRFDCFKSTGDIITEQRFSEPFTGISVSDNVNLYLTQDSLFSIYLEAGENLISLIRSEVKDRILYLDNDNTCNWVRSFKPKVNAYVSMPSLLFLEYDGCGNIFTRNIFKDDSIRVECKNGSGIIEASLDVKKCFLIIHTGPADFNISGKADELQLYYNGSGMIHTENLPNHYTYVTQKSTGDCFINVDNLLIYNISWTGDIFYTGAPSQVQGNITGTGQAIPF